MVSTTTAVFPPLNWAQRADYVFITIPLQDTKNVKIDLKDNGQVLDFACTTDAEGEKHYACQLALFRPVLPEESSHVARPRQIELKLKKASALKVAGDGEEAEESEEDRAWPRLTKDKQKNANIQIDWSKWKDEDDDDDNELANGNDMGDFGGNGMFGGMMDGESDGYGDMMSNLMRQAGRGDAEAFSGQEMPEFGSAAAAATGASGEGNGGGAEENEGGDDDDEMPPLEEDN